MRARAKMWGLFFLMLGFLLTIAVGCGSQAKPTAATPSLKLGVLSLEDILPMIVANEKGYFTEEGLIVELIHFQSALESQSAIQSGEIDGMMTDMVVAALLKAGGTDLKVTSVTLEATAERRRFAIVVPPDSPIETVADLAGKELGISFNSIIEYTSDALLQAAGLDPDEVIKTAIPKIPVRLEMLLNNKIEAANLPDPLITFAEFNGCRTIVDDRGGSISQAVLVMTAETLKEKQEALGNFYQAYRRAVQEINGQPGDFKELMAANISIPEPILGDYQLPLFPEPGLPGEAAVEQVLTWLQAKELIGQDFTYEEFVETGLY